MKTNQFDERQLQIRGQVFAHGMYVALALLLINALLQGCDIAWASGFHQNILMFIAAVTVVSVEAIVRGAYFAGKAPARMIIGIFGVISLVLLFGSLRHIAQGAALTENGGLTDSGFSLVYLVMPISITAAGAAKGVMEKRKNGE